METNTIAELLRLRNAWFKGESGDTAVAMEHKALSQMIAADYPGFEDVRDAILQASDAYLRREKLEQPAFTAGGLALAEAFINRGVAFRHANGPVLCELHGRKYLSGGWLEELAWLAAMEAGADEAVFGQILTWKVREFNGENEIDLIARKGRRLCFVSCKALRSELDIHDRKHRNRLMDAVHEADNLSDHFGTDGESVAVLVTTDLIDEIRGVARYNALMGKAAVLDVRIIPLEELGWDKLVSAMRGLLESRVEVGVQG